MISKGQGLACRKQQRVVSDAVEIKGQGLDWNIGYKKKITFIYNLMHGSFIFFYCFFYQKSIIIILIFYEWENSFMFQISINNMADFFKPPKEVYLKQ